MKDTLLTRRYAKAFLEYTIKNDMVDQGLADLELLTQTFNEQRELRIILSQPFISKEKKESIVKRIFEDKLSPNTLKFIIMMIEKSRPSIIPQILDVFRYMYYEYKNIARVIITSAVPIDEATQQRFLVYVKEIISGQIEIVNVIDKDIIGGFIVNYKDYQYDQSVRTKLKNLESLFTGNLYVKGY